MALCSSQDRVGETFFLETKKEGLGAHLRAKVDEGYDGFVFFDQGRVLSRLHIRVKPLSRFVVEEPRGHDEGNLIVARHVGAGQMAGHVDEPGVEILVASVNHWVLNKGAAQQLRAARAAVGQDHSGLEWSRQSQVSVCVRAAHDEMGEKEERKEKDQGLRRVPCCPSAQSPGSLPHAPIITVSHPSLLARHRKLTYSGPLNDHVVVVLSGRTICMPFTVGKSVGFEPTVEGTHSSTLTVHC